MLDALAADRYGLAVASGPAPAQVKALALAEAEGTDSIAPTRQNIRLHRYPFARPIFAYFNRKPGTPLDAPVAQFLRYALSAEGQGEARESEGYLPLTELMARNQSQKLD